MQLSMTILALALASTSMAWKLDLHSTDGGVLKLHGDGKISCHTITKSISKVAYVNWTPQDRRGYVLYSDNGCGNKVTSGVVSGRHDTASAIKVEAYSIYGDS